MATPKETASKTKKARRKGHGRLGADDYPGAEKVTVPHEDLSAGDLCPSQCGGKLYVYNDKGKVIRIDGGMLAQATQYDLERLRCSCCTKLYSAKLPEKAGKNKYSARFKAGLALSHYIGGNPFYRIAQQQRYSGVPLPATTQFRCMETLFGKVLPVHQALLALSKNADDFSVDDTPALVLSTQALIKQQNLKRTGTFTTGVIAHYKGHEIHLLFTGQNHAGENLAQLIEHRDVMDKAHLMCDALSRNTVTIDNQRFFLAYCLVHARRRFYESYDTYPDFCVSVLNAFTEIYQHEAYCIEHQLTDTERWNYHRQHSRPVMRKLYRKCLDEKAKKTIEPNSSLGKAIHYLIKHRRGLTRFLRTPGARIDNNHTERLLKRFVTYRKNSLFFRNEYGALIGNVLTSLLLTAIKADVNPLDYLTWLQKHADDVRVAPHHYLPWEYKTSQQKAA